MKVLVTGAHGQLGRALVACAPGTANVHALGRDQLDLADPISIADAMDALAPDVIVNAGAYTAVDRAESEADVAFSCNRDGPAVLSRIASAKGVRLVHVSTDFVFDGCASSPVKPSTKLNPLSVYGASKAAGEEAVRAALPEALIVRTAWVYGANGKSFVATMLRLARNGGPLRVVADQVGTPTHATSLAASIWALLGRDARGTFHVTDAGVASWYDFAIAIIEEAVAARLLDASVPVLPIVTADFPTPARRPAYSVLDKSTTWELLGTPARHWRHELRDMLAEEARK